MNTYLVSRPGRPLHLTVPAYDRTEHQPDWGNTCRYVPLCGQDRGAKWQLTGPWREDWLRHRGAPICSRCHDVLYDITAAAAAALREQNIAWVDADLEALPGYTVTHIGREKR